MPLASKLRTKLRLCLDLNGVESFCDAELEYEVLDFSTVASILSSVGGASVVGSVWAG